MFKGKEIDLPAIRLYSNGKFEIVGGIGFIPVNFTLPLGPVEMSVTGLHIGSIQKEYNGVIRNYNFIGFDGSLSIDPIGVDIKGNGVKYYYTTDDDEHGGSGDHYLHISTLELDLIIPGSASESQAIAIIKGSLTLPEPGVSDEYAGSVSIKLPKAKISGSADMKLNPKNKSFLVKAAVEFPNPIIPLGFVGIYGFAGLIGKKYVADKKAVFADDTGKTWYDYFMAPKRGVNIDKFRDPTQSGDYNNPFAVGFGASLATMADGGRTFSLRAMLVLSLPSVFSIEAGMAILSERLLLTDDKNAPFYAGIIFGDSSFESFAGVDYQINKTKGWFIDIEVEVQIGFFFKNQRPWYINFGTKEKPVKAVIFKDILNIRAESYIMISAAGIEAGAKVGFDFDLYIARAWVMIEIGGHISFERPQVGGYMYIEGGASLNLFVVKVSIAVSLFFTVELIKPFLIYAQLRIKIKLKLAVFIKINFSVTLTFKWEKEKNVDRAAIAPLTFEPVTDPDYSKQRNTDNYVKGIHMLTNEVFALHFIKYERKGMSETANYPPASASIDDKYIIPLDTFIDIKVEKGLSPSNSVDKIIGSHTGMANNFIELIPPQETVKGGKKVRQVKHKYSIEAIDVKIAVNNEWKDYNPYEALFPEENMSAGLKTGHWQLSNDRYDIIRLLATSAFSYMDSGEPGWMVPEQFGITPSSLFCTAYTDQWHISNFLNTSLGTEYTPPAGYDAHLISGAYYNIEGTFLQTVEVDENGSSTDVFSNSKMIVKNTPNPFGFAQSLEFRNGDNLVITLPEASVQVKLNLTTYSKGVILQTYKRIVSDAINPEYQIIDNIYLAKEQLSQQIIFGNPQGMNNPEIYSLIKIIPNADNRVRIDEINQEIAAIWQEATANAGEGAIKITLTSEQETQLELLENELEKIKSEACTEVGCSGLIFKILDDIFVDDPSQLQETYFINDNITFQNKLNEIGYSGALNVDFSKNSVLILSLSAIIADYVTPTISSTVKKIIDNGDLLCINIEEDRIIIDTSGSSGAKISSNEIPLSENNYGKFKYSIIRIEKTPEKPIEQTYEDCRCNDSNPVISACTTSVQEIRWKTLTEYEYQQTIPEQDAVTEDAQATMEALSKTIQPIWRPNSKFLLHFRLKDEVDNSVNNTKVFDYYYSFKTMGPVGHFHRQKPDYLINYDEKDEDGNYKTYKEEEKAVTSLRSYLDYKRSYPNPDGNLMGSKPLFYGNEQCKIDLFFDKAFAYHMFNDWKSYQGLEVIKMDMPVAIKDPVSEVIIPYPLPENWDEEDVPAAEYAWADDEDPNLPLSIQTYLAYWNAANENQDNTIYCDVNLGDPIVPNAKMRTVTLSNLKPEKLYTAIIYNAYDADENGEIKDRLDNEGNIIYAERQSVHDFGFRTSRYANFREQIMSYQLKETDDKGNILAEKQSVYEISMDLTTSQIDNLYALVSKTPNAETDALRNSFIHEFDRTLEGILKISPLDPPVNTDFVKIINSNSDEIIAVFVRNPEPFNDPRISLEYAEDTLQVIDNEINSQYKILWSKDYSQAVIMHSSKKIIAESLQFQFTYKTWDGNKNKYVVKDESSIDESLRLNTVITELITFND